MGSDEEIPTHIQLILLFAAKARTANTLDVNSSHAAKSEWLIHIFADPFDKQWAKKDNNVKPRYWE